PHRKQMIGKIVKGTYFRGVLDYLANKKQSKLIGGNMLGTNPKSLADEFELSKKLNRKLKKIVNHVSLSLPLDETVDEATWNKIAGEYIEAMGFQGSQYVVYRHSDRAHDHIHIVSSRIRLTDGTTVSDSWDYRRSDQIIRNLEQKHQLTPIQSSWSKERTSITREELQYLKKTGEPSVRIQLQETIDRIAKTAKTMPQFLAEIEKSGIKYNLHSHSDGSIKGISYQLDEIHYPGYKLGRAYSFFGLTKYRQISYSFDLHSQTKEIEALKINTRSILNKLVNESSSSSLELKTGTEGTTHSQQLELELTHHSSSNKPEEHYSTKEILSKPDSTVLTPAAVIPTPLPFIPEKKNSKRAKKLLLELIKLYGVQYLTGIEPLNGAELIEILAEINSARDNQETFDREERRNEILTTELTPELENEARAISKILSECGKHGTKRSEDNYSVTSHKNHCQINWNPITKRLILTDTEQDKRLLEVIGEKVIHFSSVASERIFCRDVAQTMKNYLEEYLAKEKVMSCEPELEL
ncbi:MAG: relaxase/mobilization nuclease domain-containing protein, partial [Prochloraceae cyanobacterium]|nr:relaxase/mobilization nuclease domain-containing protein [Prochloraceae cyanobacterium]